MSSRGNTIGFYRGKKGKGGRLFVGVRGRNYHAVYYEPLGKPNDNGEADIVLFAQPSGRIKDEPMIGEVLWNHWYKVEKDESTRQIERDIIQRQDLYKFWKYLETKNENEAAALEKEISDMGMKRQNGFLKVAKDWRRVDTRTRAATRRRRERRAQQAGLSPDEADINSDASDDSAYESDEEEQRVRMLELKRKRNEMGPPPRPGQSSKKRKGKGAADGTGLGAKHGRGGERFNPSPNNLFMSPEFGSGGLGPRLSDSPVGMDRSDSPDILDGREDSLDSLSYDKTDPRTRDGRADSPFDETFGLGDQKDVQRSVEGDTRDDSDKETPEMRRKVHECNGRGVDADTEIERLKHLTSVDRGNDQQDGQFGSNQETHGRRRTSNSQSQRVRSRDGRGSSRVRSSSRQSRDRRSSSRTPAQAAAAHWGTLITPTSLGGGNGTAAQSSGATRAPTEQSDMFALKTPNAPGQLTTPELANRIGGDLPATQPGTEAPVQEDDGGADENGTTEINGAQGEPNTEGEGQGEDEGKEVNPKAEKD